MSFLNHQLKNFSNKKVQVFLLLSIVQAVTGCSKEREVGYYNGFKGFTCAEKVKFKDTAEFHSLTLDFNWGQERNKAGDLAPEAVKCKLLVTKIDQTPENLAKKSPDAHQLKVEANGTTKKNESGNTIAECSLALPEMKSTFNFSLDGGLKVGKLEALTDLQVTSPITAEKTFTIDCLEIDRPGSKITQH